MSIYKTLTEEELPKNLQQVKVVEAQQLVNGKQLKIDPQQVKVNGATRVVKLNLTINTPKEGV